MFQFRVYTRRNSGESEVFDACFQARWSFMMFGVFFGAVEMNRSKKIKHSFVWHHIQTSQSWRTYLAHSNCASHNVCVRTRQIETERKAGRRRGMKGRKAKPRGTSHETWTYSLSKISASEKRNSFIPRALLFHWILSHVRCNKYAH